MKLIVDQHACVAGWLAGWQANSQSVSVLLPLVSIYVLRCNGLLVPAGN